MGRIRELRIEILHSRNHIAPYPLIAILLDVAAYMTQICGFLNMPIALTLSNSGKDLSIKSEPL